MPHVELRGHDLNSNGGGAAAGAGAHIGMCGAAVLAAAGHMYTITSASRREPPDSLEEGVFFMPKGAFLLSRRRRKFSTSTRRPLVNCTKMYMSRY